MEKILKYDAVVVGSGAAGFNAACQIAKLGKKTVAIVTENVNSGTSRNAGSDKQTYYKMSIGGDATDSVRRMAQDLFDGGAVDGDNALCEAALSTKCFINLASLGVEFPTDRYGRYVGYKTDHDPCARATSAGPLTSKFMTEALEKQAKELNIPIHSGQMAIQVMKDDSGAVCGLLTTDEKGELTVFRTRNVILATGGPAGIYKDSVYPFSQTGSTGLALEAGASLQNMTEWQYGLASVSPRWNVSGTYMQVLPRFVSVDENGIEREFLFDFFGDPYEALSNVFLKGYQWPFDSAKVLSGSSVIDLLVYQQTAILGRKVYLDYTKNPFGLKNIEFEKLSDEAYTYLKKCGACFGTPIKRLEKMNTPAIELYRGKGVELSREYLPIALCAQHNNGGISVDLWWQTCVKGLFAAGECAGTHGVRRPGGSALNAGQVGSLRSAEYISHSERKEISEEEFTRVSENACRKYRSLIEEMRCGPENCPLDEARTEMSKYGAAIRSPKQIADLLVKVEAKLVSFTDEVRTENVFNGFRYKDTLTVQLAVLTSMLDYAGKVGSSRGSAINTDDSGVLRDGLPEFFRFLPPDGKATDHVQQVSLKDGKAEITWRKVREIPEQNESFETIWNGYRNNHNIY